MAVDPSPYEIKMMITLAWVLMGVSHHCHVQSSFIMEILTLVKTSFHGWTSAALTLKANFIIRADVFPLTLCFMGLSCKLSYHQIRWNTWVIFLEFIYEIYLGHLGPECEASFSLRVWTLVNRLGILEGNLISIHFKYVTGDYWIILYTKARKDSGDPLSGLERSVRY